MSATPPRHAGSIPAATRPIATPAARAERARLIGTTIAVALVLAADIALLLYGLSVS